MSNFEQKKKRADEALLVANDFLKSNLAKEVFLKDDEVTPKKLNDKIQKELELHLDLNSKFIEVLKKESLPNEIFTQDYKVQMENAKEKIDNVKKNISSNFNFSFFDEIYVRNDGKSLSFFYTVNEKFNDTLYVVALLVTVINKDKRIVVSNKDGQILTGTDLTNWGVYLGYEYSFIARTNDGKEIKVLIQ
jgi:hypothetical protein